MNTVADHETRATAEAGRGSSTMSEITWTVEVDRATPEQWARTLDLFDDANIYQTAAYGGVRWGERNLSRLVLKRNGEVVAAAQLRIVKPTPLKFGMAYLRWGPMCVRHGRPVDTDVIARMAKALDEEYAEKRRLFLHVIPNAFEGSPRAETFRSAFQRFTAEPIVPENAYRTFVLDLAPTLEDLRRRLDAKWRNKLSGAEKNNLAVIAGSGIDEYRKFCTMYEQMRNRKAFETTVDVAEFERIQECLPETQRMRILIAVDKAVPVAGLVASAIGDSAIYLLGATSDEGLKAKGAYLLQWTMMQWLKANGVRWYDLGGIDPERNPGVYQFKRGFSGADVTQLGPLVACRSTFSSTMVKAGLVMQRALRGRRGAANAEQPKNPAESGEPA